MHTTNCITLLCIVFCLLYVKKTHADDKSYWSLGLETGTIFYATDNETVSPLIYSGFAPFIKLQAQYHGSSSLSLFDLLSSNLKLENDKSSLHDATIENKLILFKTGYLHKVYSIQSGRFYCGALIDGHFEIMNMEAQSGFYSISRIYFYGSIGVAPAVNFEYNIGNQHRLSLMTYVPLIYRAVRPVWDNYYIAPEEFENSIVANYIKLSKTAYINEIVTLPLELKYQYFANDRVALSSSYNYVFYSYNKPRPVKSELHKVSIGIAVLL